MRACRCALAGAALWAGAGMIASGFAATDAPTAHADLLQPASGGRHLTVSGAGRNLLLDAPTTLTGALGDTRLRGLAFFNTAFVPAVGTDSVRDGLGPLFNNAACEGCHNNAGRARAPRGDGPVPAGLVIQLGHRTATGAWTGDPVYGTTFNPAAIPRVAAEGRAVVTYTGYAGQFSDGERWVTRAPDYRLEGLNYGPLAPGTVLSPRLAQALSGMGLLEAVPDATLLALAAAEAGRNRGAPGRPNRVTDTTGQTRLGRFGWKAGHPDLRAQTVSALANEQGITTRDAPLPTCTPVQTACLEAPDGGKPELNDQDLEAILVFLRTLPVPARRGLHDPAVRRGAGLFVEAGCDGCHVPRLVTGPHALPELAGQVIYPFTDLLLHDLGPGLADGRPEHAAGPAEWRTPPLWGLGRVAELGSEASYLHDGRARTLAEAILWHGGAALRARQTFEAWPAAVRAALYAFLESL